MNIINTGPIPLKKKPTVEGKKAPNPIADAISKIATAAPKTPLQLARGEIMPEGYNITAKRNPGTLEGAMAEWDKRNPNASRLQRDTVKYKLQAFLIDGPKTQAGWRAKRAGDLLAAYEADQMELHRIGAEREFNQASAMALSDIGAGIDERVAGVVPGSGTVSQFSRGVVKGIASFVNPVDQAAMLYQTSNAIDQPELFGDLAKGLARPLTVWFDPSATAEEKGMAMAQLALIAAPLGAKGFPRIKAAIKNMGVSEAKAYATMERLAGELLKNPKTASVGKALKRTLAEEPPPVSFEDKTPKVTFRRKQDAVQIEEPNESVLRQEGQELELQKVGEGNQGPQKPAGKGKKGKEKEVGGKTSKPGRGRKPAQEKPPLPAEPSGQPADPGAPPAVDSGISPEARSRIDDLVQAELARMDKSGQTPMPERAYGIPPTSVSIDLLTINRARKALEDPNISPESTVKAQADLIGAERRVAEWGEKNGWGEIAKEEPGPEPPAATAENRAGVAGQKADAGVPKRTKPRAIADVSEQPSMPVEQQPKTAPKPKAKKAKPEEPTDVQEPPAAAPPATMEIEVGGKKYTISGKQIDEYMKAKAAYEAAISSAKRTAGLTPQQRASIRKAAGMKFSAEKRRIVGASTLKEQAAASAEANSVKSGDIVTTKDGVTGRVKSNAFGKVTIETENGTVTVKRSDILDRTQAAESIAPENAPESPAQPVSEPTAPLRGRARIEAAREARNARIKAELEAEGRGEKPTELQAGPKISKEDFDYLKEVALGILEEVGDNFRAFVGDIRDNGEKWDLLHLKKAWRESGGTINPSLGGRQEQIRANQEAAGLPISEKSPQTGLLSATEAVGEKNYRTEAGQAKVKEQLARIKDGKAPDVSVETQGLMVAHLKNCKIALRRAKAELAKNPKSKALQEAVAKAEADFAEATMAHFLTREESGRTVVVGKIGEPIDWANPEDLLQEATINAGKRGKKLSNKEIAEAEAMAKRVAEAEAEVAKAKEAAKQAWDEVAKMKEAKYSKRPPKKRFNSLEDFIKNGGKLVQGKTLAGEAGAARAPVDIPTPEASYHIWQHVKKNYLDKGEYNLEHIADGVVKDLEALGRTVDREYVKRAIGSPKTVRDLTTETLVKQAKERAVLRTAKAYVENAGKTPVEKLVKKVWDFPRGMLATADNSVAFTQGARRFWTNPIKASSEIKASYKMFSSEAYHEYVMQNLERRDNLGLYVYGKLDALPSVLEEQAGYMHPLEGIPVAGKIVKMSDRAFDAAKLMRANWFDELISKYPPEQRLSVAKEIASQVNAMTGRQSIGSGALAKSVQFATFAAKLEASRWRFLFVDPAVAVKKLVAPKVATDRQTALIMLKNQAKFYGTLGTALAVNKILNHDVNVGIDENTKSWKDVVKNLAKPDFANFKAFGIRIDASGGLFGPLRLMARELVSYWNQREGKPQYQSGSDIAARYLRGKSHPAVATIADLWAGTDYIGKPLPHATDRQKASARKRGLAPYTWAGYASTKTIPLTPQQAYQTFNEELKKNGVDSASREALVKTFMSFVAEFNGLRTNKDYEQKETAKTSRKIYK